MLDFQPVSITHKPLFDRCLAAEDSRASCTSFGNVYLWDVYCPRNITRLGDRIAVEYLCSSKSFYTIPIGQGPLDEFIRALRADAAAKDRPFFLRGLSECQREALESAFPGRFSFTEDRDSADYIYEVEAFASLAGKKLHGKRNFCNRFEANHSWRFEPLTPEQFDACRALFQVWTEKKQSDSKEQQPLFRLFEQWDELKMFGGILFAEEQPIAFSVGEKICSDTVDIHFEKAMDDVPGAYPMIAREMARMIRNTMPEIRFLNREEDMGLPGLRKAKEDWRPCAMGTYYIAEWQEDK